MEANLRFAGPETMETQIFGRLTAWQNWIFQRPNAVGDEGALKRLRQRRQGEIQPRKGLTAQRALHETIETINVERIPNNVGLAETSALQRALEQWHPGYIDWWMTMGPEGFQSPTSICAPR